MDGSQRATGSNLAVDDRTSCDTDDRIDWAGHLVSEDVENRYLSGHSDAGFGTVRIVVLVAAILSPPFYYSDYFMLDAPAFLWMWTARTVLFGFSVGVAVSIGRIADLSTVRNLITAWVCVYLLFTLAVNASRPPEHTAHFTLDVVVLMVLFFLFPIGTRRLLVIGLLFAAPEAFLLLQFRGELSPAVYVVVIVAFIVAVSVGALGVSRLNRANRMEFLALERAQKERIKLQDALENIRRLEGLLPTCSFCKKIRNDEGIWETIEHYIAENSEAMMSHSICPDCMKVHYPEFEGRGSN